MASSTCRSSPTLTSASTSISTSRSTSISRITTTSPGSTITSLIPVCATAANSTVCTTSTSVIVRPGATVVNTETVVVTVTVPVVIPVTLWGVSCAIVPANPPPVIPPSTTTPVYTPPTTTPVYTPPTSTTPVYTPPTSTTPPPPPSTTIYTTSSVVTEESTTYVTYFTTTAVTEPTSSPPPPPPVETSTPNNTAAIVGGALGGVALLGLLAFLTLIMIKKSNKFRDFFRSNNTNQFGSSGKEPYQYGPVNTQSTGFFPPSSPEHQPAALADVRSFNFGPGFGGVGNVGPSGTETGMQYGGTGNNTTFNAPNQAPTHHLRNPSLTPLLAGGAAVAAATGNRLQRPDTMSSSGRVSTASSDLVGPMMTHASPQQNVGYPPTAYPAGLASYAQQHGFVSPEEQQQQQQNFGHNRNGSVGSHTTMSSIPGAGSVGSNYMPFVAAGMSRPGQHPQQQYMQNVQQRYEDPFTRMGSPESIPEDSIVSQMQSTDHTTEISSTSSRVFNNTPGLRLVGGSSMSSLDGKGRPLRNPKAPMVHLDGGEYREALPGQSSSGVPQPPAYE